MKLKNLIDKLGLDQTYTKPIKNIKYDSVKNNIPRLKHLNYMADLLFLPTTKEGYKYLLVVVDLATDLFDLEPIKNKESTTVLQAFKEMFKRPYIKLPEYSVRTDAGSEFKNVFHKYLYDNSILHRVAEVGRHKQLANIESLNRQLGRLFNLYMNKMELETRDTYREWIDILDVVREELNEIRKIPERNPYKSNYEPIDTNVLLKQPKYKVGQLVYRKSDVPLNSFGKKQNTEKYREGDYRFDIQARKISKVLYYPKNIRYLLSNLNNVSYTEDELLPAEDKQEEEFEVQSIIDKKVENGKTYYLIKWKGFSSDENTWEHRDELIKTIPDLINQFDEKNKKPKMIKIKRPKSN